MPGTLVGFPVVIENANAMTTLYLRCILSALLVTSMTAWGHAQSKPAFTADFGYAEDTNRDGWPDAWRRHSDRDHPRFTKMGIASRSNVSPEELQVIRRTLAQWMLAWKLKRLPGDVIPESIPRPIDAFLEKTIADNCLEIVMNGRSARIESPSFPIDSRNAYRVQMQMMTEFIDPFVAQASIHWLDASGSEIGEQRMEPVSISKPWHILRIKETNNIPSQTRFGKLRISVTSLGSRSIQTIVRCDRIRVERIPRIELEVAPASRLVSIDEWFEVNCKLNEVDQTSVKVELVARDHEGNNVWHQTNPLAPSSGDTSEVVKSSWKLKLDQPGYYTLAVRVLDDTSLQPHKETSIVVTRPGRSATLTVNSRIGWGVPSLGNSISIQQIPQLLEFAHVGGLKFSVWSSEQRESTSRSLGWLVESLATKKIKCVGVIAPPSPELQAKFPDDNGKRLVTMLNFPQIWQPMFDPIWRRTSLFLTQYQIGWEQDDGLESSSNWQANVASLAKQIRTVGAEASLTLPWNALSEAPEKGFKNDNVPWNRLLNVATPSLTEAELSAFSQQATVDPKRRWISLDPLSHNRYSLEDRVRDLTQRLIAVHQHQWEMAWVSDPTDPQLAILDKSGGPDELLVPFEHVVDVLNNSQDFMPVRFHENLTGMLFRVANQDCAIVFATKPIEVELYLGDQWTAIDAWGRSLSFDNRLVRNVPTRHLTVGKWPIVLSNIDRMLAQWQVDVKIENPIIENRVGQSEPLRIRLQNPESRAVGGKIEVVAPLLLQEETSTASFDVPANAVATVEVPMRLRYDASQSLEPLDIVVSFNDSPDRQFVIQRQIQVGLKDFQLETQARIDNKGDVIIDLEILNLSDQIANFDCTLILPHRPREKFQIIRLEHRQYRPIVITDASEMKGQSILLRCEEIRTGRVLNHRIEIK
jgi:hypothetical protein